MNERSPHILCYHTLRLHQIVIRIMLIVPKLDTENLKKKKKTLATKQIVFLLVPDQCCMGGTQETKKIGQPKLNLSASFIKETRMCRHAMVPAFGLHRGPMEPRTLRLLYIDYQHQLLKKLACKPAYGRHMLGCQLSAGTRTLRASQRPSRPILRIL